MVMSSTLHYKVCRICCKCDVPAPYSNNEISRAFGKYFTQNERCWQKRGNHLGNYGSPSFTLYMGRTCPHEKGSLLFHTWTNFLKRKAPLDFAATKNLFSCRNCWKSSFSMFFLNSNWDVKLFRNVLCLILIFLQTIL